MAYIPETNSVIAFQSDPTKLIATVSVVSSVPQSVSGTVQADIRNSVAAVIIGGSIAASFTPPANQSVSGEVSVSNFPTTQNVSGSVAAFLQSTNASIITVGGATGNSSVQVLNFPANQSVSGAVSVSNFPTNQNVSGSVIAFQGAGWSGSVAAVQVGTRSTSIVNIVPSSLIVGASIFGLPPVNVTNTNLNVGGSVVAFQGAGWSGSVATTQIGVRSTSVVNIVPSSMIVGASIFGALPPVSISNTNLNVGGSVVAFQGTTPWVIQSIVGTYAEDTLHSSGDKGLFALGVRNDAVASFAGANLDYTPIATDSAGRVLANLFAPEEARVEGYASLVSTSVTTLVAAAGAGLRNYITDFFIANTGATTTLITFKDGAGSILGYTIAPAGGGSNAPGLATPIRTGANATFDFQPTSASSILYATVKGFKAP